MSDGLFALALGAGMLAAVNPCGFALLPAYLALLVTDEARSRPAIAVGRALLLTAAMTAGFMAVFGVFGLTIAPVASSVQRYLPWFTVVLGIVLAGAGVWLVSGRHLPGLAIHRGRAPVRRSARSMIGFGASYAIASLSCTIAPFLAVVVSAFRADDVLTGVALFLAYGVGMGLVVAAAAVAVALANTEAVRRLRRAGSAVPRIAGVLLAVSGLYVAYYAWWEIRTLRGTVATDDRIIATASTLQQHIASAVDRFGLPAAVALITVLAVVSIILSRGRVPRQK